MQTITLRTQAWGSLAFVALLLSAPTPARAQNCETDGDCGAGYVCHTERFESCSGMTCKPGAPCPPPSCDTYESKYCVNAPCSADSDCQSSMRCYAQIYTECSGGGAMLPSCDPGAGGCDAPVALDAGVTECHDVTSAATCTPRYSLPCHADGDCGAGFVCEEQIYTACSGGGMGGSPADTGMATSGGSAGSSMALDAGPAGAFECHEEHSGSFACRLLDLPCDSNADCATGLECQSNPFVSGCTSGIGGAAMGAAGMSSGSVVDAGSPIAVDAGSSDCGPSPTPAQACVPHDYYRNGMFPNPSPGMGGGNGGSTGSAQDAGVEPPQDTGSGSGNTTGGSAGSAGDESGGHGQHHHGQHHAAHFPHVFGCAVSGGDAGSQLASWFGLVGLIALGLRRRARRAL